MYITSISQLNLNDLNKIIDDYNKSLDNFIKLDLPNNDDIESYNKIYLLLRDTISNIPRTELLSSLSKERYEILNKYYFR